jgi:hypothetical protein
VESKGKAPDMKEGAGSHRGGAAPVGWWVRMATAALEVAVELRLSTVVPVGSCGTRRGVDGEESPNR